MFKLNGKPIFIDRDLTIGDVTYPADSLRDQALRVALGIVEEPDPVRPDDRWYWVTENPDGSIKATPKDLAGLRAGAVAEIKRQRQVALDTFARSAGVAEIYAENLRAAQAYAAGAGKTTVMRDGTTAEAYLGTMAASMRLTLQQFVDYILAENTTAAQRAREIEAEHVRLVYSFIPKCSFEEVQAVVPTYQEFCHARFES